MSEQIKPEQPHHHHHPMERPEGSVSLDNIIRANGDEHIFRFAMELGSNAEQEPPIIFHWQHASEFVEAIRTLPKAGATDAEGQPPFPIPEPLAEKSFKAAVMGHLRYENEDIPTEFVETSILPYTVDYLGQCVAKMVELRHYPWIQQMTHHGGQRILPLAVPYIARPQTEIVKRFLGTQTKTLWS